MATTSPMIRILRRGLDALDAARELGHAPSAILDRSWRAALDVTRYDMIPRDVRAQIRTACDVGANRGGWSAGLLRLAPIERLVAIEPNPSEFATLTERLSGFQQVRCVNAAAGDRPGTVTLNIESISELSSILEMGAGAREVHGVAGAPASQVEVPQVTLDDTLADFDELSLLKIDVQGYEREVLEGARDVLKRCRSLFIEVLYDPDYYKGALRLPELIQFVEGLSPLRLSHVSEAALNGQGRGLWADALFLHPDL